MKKKLIRGIAFLLVCMSFLIVTDANVYAAEAVNINVTNVETTVGGEVQVTISLTGNKEEILMVDMWITYDAEVLQAVDGFNSGGGGKIRILSDSGATSYTLTFKGLKAGNSGVGVISEQSIVSSTNTDQMELYAGAGTVTVKGAATQSKNNNLSALTVSPGALTPAFSKDVTTYNITLNEYVSRLTISATPEDSKAAVSVVGAVMDPGDNTTKITVTAENGDKKVYTIYTKIPVEQKIEEKDILVDVNGVMHNVVSNFDEDLLPEGYEAIEYTYKDNNILVGKGISNGKIIFCVRDAAVESGTKQFAVYDEQTGTFSQLKLITTNGISYTVVDDDTVLSMITIPEGFVESEFTLNNIKYRVWVDGNSPAAQYFIIYCTNFAGDTSWYQYDMVEGTMQRAFLNGFSPVVEETSTEASTEVTEEAANGEQTKEMSELQAEYDSYVSKTKIALIMMGVLLAAVIVVMVIFAIRSFHDSHKEMDDDNIDEEMYEQPSRHGVIDVSDVTDKEDE